MNCHVLHIEKVTFNRQLEGLHQGTCTYKGQEFGLRCNDYVREEIGESSSITAKGRLIGNKNRYCLHLTDVSLPEDLVF